MKDCVDYMIENKSGYYAAKTKGKKDILISEIFNKIGVRLSNKLTLKELKSVLEQ